jgi:hypothetical protein
MTKRRSITKAMRVRIFDAAKGHCHLCKLPINAPAGERWEVEHINPLWLGGKDDETNMAPVHVDCHSVKSKAEAPVRAKTTRQRAAHIGAKSEGPKIQSAGFQPVAKPSKIARVKIEKQPVPNNSQIAQMWRASQEPGE